ncbi:pseudouridine synthase [Mycena rebaudengoi]|nr:pseudouridine synthase [Mycena rebaudengoi]
MAPSLPDSYDTWSRDDLVRRLVQLELKNQEPERETTTPPPPNRRRLWRSKEFDFSSYPRRKIALKFCYSGWDYHGLVVQADPTPLPTVEGVLFKALARARLIDPDAGLEGCGWERCGRTDCGVSAGGQVISLWVRSALDAAPPPSKPIPILEEPIAPSSEPPDDTFPGLDAAGFGTLDDIDFIAPTNASHQSEHSYTLILNRILPPTIRILAWSPVTPEFSSRFACTSRHYKYFFSAEGLDIPRMAEAASLLVGGHDFRNFCKMDPAKQLTVYRREILSAQISEVPGGALGMHVLDLRGNAFLYHQVRHIMAVLFLVGAGLEQPLVVKTMLNVDPGAEGDPALPVVDCRPEYQMADALPLMLYECHYPPGAVDWQTEVVPEDDSSGPLPPVGAGLYHRLQSIHARSEMYAMLNHQFASAAAAHAPNVPPPATIEVGPSGKRSIKVPLGGATFRRQPRYVPLLDRKRSDHYEVTNERWRVGRGAKQAERRKIAEEDDGGDE